MNKKWEKIKDFPNYQISNLGEVINTTTNKLLKARDNGNGYLYISLYNHQKKKRYYIHRLVATYFIPNPENKQQVNHKNGDKSNNCIENLEWVTCSENIKHAWRNGLNHNTKKKLKASLQNLKKITKDKMQIGYQKRCFTFNIKSKKGETRWESRNQFKPLYCLELHKVFLCASRITEKLGIKGNTVASALSRGRNYSCGFHWKYLKNKWQK